VVRGREGGREGERARCLPEGKAEEGVEEEEEEADVKVVPL